MADFRGGDLDRHITGAYGARSNMGGEEPDLPFCEACGTVLTYDDMPENPHQVVLCDECADDPEPEL